MIIALVVAMDRRRGIGFENTLPWRLSDDLKKFKEITIGHHIVFGRKTFESIGKALPGRTTIIISRQDYAAPEGCVVVGSVEAAIDFARQHNEQLLCICGGAEIYRLALPFADRLYITDVDADVVADTFFPDINDDSTIQDSSYPHSGKTVWKEVERQTFTANEKNQYDFTFRILEKVQ